MDSIVTAAKMDRPDKKLGTAQETGRRKQMDLLRQFNEAMCNKTDRPCCMCMVHSLQFTKYYKFDQHWTIVET